MEVYLVKKFHTQEIILHMIKQFYMSSKIKENNQNSSSVTVSFTHSIETM